MSTKHLIKEYGLWTYLRYRHYYQKKMKGNVMDLVVGYSDWATREDIGSLTRIEMDGKRGVYRIIGIGECGGSVCEDIELDFIGYEYENDNYYVMKPIRECTLAEFMWLYREYLENRKRWLRWH